MGCDWLTTSLLWSESRPRTRQHGDQQEDGPAGGFTQNAPGVPQAGDHQLPGRYTSTHCCTHKYWEQKLIGWSQMRGRGLVNTPDDLKEVVFQDFVDVLSRVPPQRRCSAASPSLWESTGCGGEGTRIYTRHGVLPESTQSTQTRTPPLPQCNKNLIHFISTEFYFS